LLLAVASVGGVTPCGACRQVLAKFGPDLTILLDDVTTSDEPRVVQLAELLPDRFTRGQP
jgi:cytidine deaminase